MKQIIVLIILISAPVLPQHFEFLGNIGNFDRASSFYITADGLIYVTDAGKDEVIMLDTLGNILKTFGGYGWNENSFDDPADIFADPLTIYVADKNNHSIKRFDKNLNYLSSLFTRDNVNSGENFGYPLSCATSNQGDLYLIDSENNRVLKFDIFGKFIQNFGGFDAGSFTLEEPVQLAIASNNNIFVLDGTRAVVFDQYGNGILKINLGKRPNSIRLLFDRLTIASDDEILFSDLRLPDARLSPVTLRGIDMVKGVKSALVLNNMLYVLTERSILIFSGSD